jgi:hypothetical protein
MTCKKLERESSGEVLYKFDMVFTTGDHLIIELSPKALDELITNFKSRGGGSYTSSKGSTW